MSEAKQSGRTGTLWIATGIALLLGLVILFRGCGGPQNELSKPEFEVRRGPLTISISQSGTLKAQEQEIITSQVQGRNTLIHIIPEGTRVEKGDLLVEIDSSSLKDRLVERKISVQNAEAKFIQARENVAVTESQNETDISAAELKHRFAKEDLEKYVEGEYRQQLREAESKITLAEEELQLARQKLEWSEKLYSENYISQSERDADQLAFNRARLDLDLARAAKNLLENYTYRREIAQLESDVEQTRRALERVELKAGADLIRAKADFNAREAELQQQKDQEVKIEDQISKTRITAPKAGLVVYATSAKANWRGNEEPLEAGQDVRERQELIYLPTADQMKAEVQIHESNLDKIQLGLPAVMTVDALQGRQYQGKITRIAPLPDAASMWMNPDLKVYRTEITLEGDQSDLRTGMSCEAEIIVETYEDVLYIPVQAVIRRGGEPMVYVRSGKAFEPVPVTVGLDNNRMIHIVDGLEEGQRVLLSPPLEDGTDSETEQERPEASGGRS